jgi:hypothetical protein
MTVQIVNLDIVTANFTIPVLTPVTAIEENYFRSLSTFPDNEALQRRVPPVGSPQVNATPPTTLGVGIELYTPPVLNITGGTNLSVNQAAATTAAGAVFTIGATGLAGVAGIPFATLGCQYLDLFLEYITKETNPYYRFGYNDIKLDTRLVDSGVTVVRDINVAQPVFNGADPTINMIGVGRYKHFRIMRPWKKIAANTDILQFRVGVPQIGSSVVNTTPTGVFRLHILGTVNSAA